MLRRGLHQDESGAILVFTAMLLVVLLGFAALAVDLGNAWSNDRRTQTAADIAAVGALQVIPHTFRDVYPGNPPPGWGAETLAQGEASELITINNGTPGTIDVDLADGGGNVAVEAAATIDSDNAFARAVGAGALVTVDGAGRAEVLANEPTVDLLPFGFNATNDPYRCLADPTVAPPPASGCTRTASPSPSQDVQILALRRRDTDPMCTDSASTMTANLASGADHLVDLSSTGVRNEKDACSWGHVLTMPTTTQQLPAGRGDFSQFLTNGLEARLAGNTTQLWDELLPALPGACDRAAIQALAPDLQAQSALMSQCLSSGDAEFQAGLLASDAERLGWAIDTSSGGAGVRYDGYVLVWINTVITFSAPSTFTDHISPPGSPLVGFTAFILDESMLNDTIEFDPGGVDNLEFQIVG